MAKILRITTISKSLLILLKGQLSFMNRYYEIIGVSWGLRDLNEVAKREGIRVIEVEMTRTINPVRDLKTLLRLYKIMRNEKPDIVHTHTPKAGILGMLAAWLCRVPVRMHTVAGLPLIESTGFKRIILEIVERITYSCATKVYPNSFGLRDFILKNEYCSLSKLKVIGNGSTNGIDSNYFSRNAISKFELETIRNNYHLSSENFIFIFIGRLVKDKGINELVLAFDSLYKNNDNVKLFLVGFEEPELDPLEKQTLDILTKNPAIILTGWQSDVRPLLAVANVMVFPSYREGLPNVPLQACAMDVPCIVTDINGCNEIIKNEYNGLLIPVKNAKALQAAMERLLIENDLYLKLKSNTRDSVINKYDQKIIWEKIREEYVNHLNTTQIV